MKTIRAIYENGVLRPTEALDLPEGAELEFELKRTRRIPNDLAAIYHILSERYASGEKDVAERHHDAVSADSPIVVEVRRRRMEISAEFGHDLAKYVAHLQEVQRQYQDRVVNQVTVVRAAEPTPAGKT